MAPTSLPLKLHGLIGLATILVVTHLSIVLRLENMNLTNVSIIVWAGCGFLVWEKRKQLVWTNSLLASSLGLGIIAIVLFKNSQISSYHLFLRFVPLLGCLGLALVASGIKGLKQYWQELTILLLTTIPPGLINRFAPWNVMTAKLSHFLLYYIGVDIHRSRDIILSIGTSIPTINNSVRVDERCAGAETMLQLWALAIVAIFLLPTTKQQKITIPLTALAIAFLINSIRVAILVTIVHDRPTFDYWHLGQGGQIFPLAAILVWGIICKFIILRDHQGDHQKS